MRSYRQYTDPIALPWISEADWLAFPPVHYLMAGNLDTPHNDLQVNMPVGRATVAVFTGTRHDGDIFTWRENLGMWVPCGDIDITGTASANKVKVLQNSTDALEVRRVDDFDATTSKTGTGSGLMETYGDHTHAADVDYVVEIDTAGDEQSATFKWSADGVEMGTLVPVSAVSRTHLQYGVYVLFSEGTYDLADTWAWTAIGTANQSYDLKVDTTNSQLWVGTKLLVANDSNFALYLTAVGRPIILLDTNVGISYDRSVKNLTFSWGGSVGDLLTLDGSATPRVTLGTVAPLITHNYIQLGLLATPATPGSGAGRLYANYATVPRPYWIDANGVNSVLAFTSEVPPLNADYLVGTANATLTGEIVVGTTPGGELGGTWASPTVDATHSGSAHHTRAHTIASASDHTGTADKVIYVDHAGAIQELSLGADGTVLKSAGTASAPAFEADSRVINMMTGDAATASTTVGKYVVIVPFACTVTACEAIIGHAETCGATSLILDLHKIAAADLDTNGLGTTMFTTTANRPTVANTHRLSSTTVPDVTAIAAGDGLVPFVDQAGTGVTTVTLAVTVSKT
jgi:hypothetical protein